MSAVQQHPVLDWCHVAADTSAAQLSIQGVSVQKVIHGSRGGPTSDALPARPATSLSMLVLKLSCGLVWHVALSILW